MIYVMIFYIYSSIENLSTVTHTSCLQGAQQIFNALNEKGDFPIYKDPGFKTEFFFPREFFILSTTRYPTSEPTYNLSFRTPNIANALEALTQYPFRLRLGCRIALQLSVLNSVR